MNAHFIVDDQFINAFVDGRKDIFLNNDDIFVIAHKRADAGYARLRHPIVLDRLVSLEDFRNTFLARLVQDPSARVYVHFLHRDFYAPILELPDWVRVYWFFWGADFYSPLSKYADSILDPRTRELYFLQNRFSKLVPLPFNARKTIVRAFHAWRSDLRTKRSVIGRINFFMHWNEKDFDLIRSEYQTAMQFVFFRYTMGEAAFPRVLLAEPGPSERSFSTILFGNSSHYANNHLDGIETLRRKLSEANVRVYCPLSYGPREVVPVVEQEGHRAIGERFVPLKALMSFDDYWRFVKNDVDVLFMNHIRTNAAANVIRSIYLGKKIYLRSANTLFQLLRDSGIHVGSIEDEFKHTSVSEIVAPLPINVQESNRELITQVISDERVRVSNALVFR